MMEKQFKQKSARTQILNLNALLNNTDYKEATSTSIEKMNGDHFIMDSDSHQPFFDADFSMIPDRGPEEVPKEHR
jgi:hypothetical protein